MKDEFVTTNVRLPKTLWEELKRKALSEGKSLGELIREGAAYIIGNRVSGKKRIQDDPFFKIIGAGKGDKTGSTDHDDIYEDKDLC
jgi:hypothetical protein